MHSKKVKKIKQNIKVYKFPVSSKALWKLNDHILLFFFVTSLSKLDTQLIYRKYMYMYIYMNVIDNYLFEVSI